jgi:DNA transformation protein
VAVSPAYTEYVIDQLSALGSVRSRRMFGAVGLYLKDVFFGLISEETLYFKVDDVNRADYLSRGMEAFRPYAKRPQVSMSYYAVPLEALEDDEELVRWARQSVRAAQTGRRR